MKRWQIMKQTGRKNPMSITSVSIIARNANIGLDIWYNQNRDVESCTGWHWEISDGSGQVRDSAGNKHARRYEPDIGALDEIKKEALLRFNSLPCSRSN
jgi:hypothetical protein